MFLYVWKSFKNVCKHIYKKITGMLSTKCTMLNGNGKKSTKRQNGKTATATAKMESAVLE